MIAFHVADMTDARGAAAVTQAIKAADRSAQVRVDLKTRTVDIEASKAGARQLSEAINQAGYSPEAA
jgi:copper chaperone CopZ